MTCIGDEKNYSYVSSRNGRTLSDFVAKYVLKKRGKKFSKYSWLQRGSDERQYCAPGVDLPICSINRTKPGYYPEYHTSLDKLGTVVTKKGLNQSYHFFQECINTIENSLFPKVKVLCEPLMSKRGLYPTISGKSDTSYHKQVREMMSVLSYSDGLTSANEIAEICKLSESHVYSILKNLKKSNVIRINYEN
jgi:aminopeptidase-like protein